MSIAELVLSRPRGPRFGRGEMFADSGIELDVSISEQEEHASEVVTHPVERGTPIADMRSKGPVVLRLSALVSSTPTDLVGSLGTAVAGGDRARDQYDELLAFYEDEASEEPMTIVTGFKTYSNMVFKDLQLVRRPDLAGALEFQATFVEVRYANSRRIALAEDVVGTAGPKKTPGPSAPKPVDTAAAGPGRSLLDQAAHFTGVL